MFILMRSPLHRFHSPIDGTGLSKQLTQKKKHMLIHCNYRCPAFRQTHNIPHYWSPQNDAEPLLSLEKALGGVTCRSLEVASSTLATLPRSLQARSKAFRGGKAHDIWTIHTWSHMLGPSLYAIGCAMVYYITTWCTSTWRSSVMFRPECEASHLNNSYTLFRVVHKKGGSPRTNLHVSKDFHWLQLKSKLNFFCRWTCDIYSACSTL